MKKQDAGLLIRLKNLISWVINLILKYLILMVTLGNDYMLIKYIIL